MSLDDVGTSAVQTLPQLDDDHQPTGSEELDAGLRRSSSDDDEEFVVNVAAARGPTKKANGTAVTVVTRRRRHQSYTSEEEDEEEEIEDGRLDDDESGSSCSHVSPVSDMTLSMRMCNSDTSPENLKKPIQYNVSMSHKCHRSIGVQTIPDPEYPSFVYYDGPHGDSRMEPYATDSVNCKAINVDELPMRIMEQTSQDSLPEGTLRLVIENFSLMVDTVRGPSKIIQNVPWRIMVMPRQHIVQKKGTQKCLGFFLQCCPDAYSDSWSCQAAAELRLISQKSGVPNFSRKTNHVYTSKENDWGYSCFMTWADILDEAQGYILNDTVILEVHVKADPAKNILSLSEFRKKIDEYIRVAQMQCDRGLIDKAIDCNSQAMKFCKDKDPECYQRLKSQNDDLVARKLQQSIARIEREGDSTEADPAANLTALKAAMTGTNGKSGNGARGKRVKDAKASGKNERSETAQDQTATPEDEEEKDKDNDGDRSSKNTSPGMEPARKKRPALANGVDSSGKGDAPENGNDGELHTFADHCAKQMFIPPHKFRDENGDPIDDEEFQRQIAGEFNDEDINQLLEDACAIARDDTTAGKARTPVPYRVEKMLKSLLRSGGGVTMADFVEKDTDTLLQLVKKQAQPEFLDALVDMETNGLADDINQLDMNMTEMESLKPLLKNYILSHADIHRSVRKVFFSKTIPIQTEFPTASQLRATLFERAQMAQTEVTRINAVTSETMSVASSDNTEAFFARMINPETGLLKTAQPSDDAAPRRGRPCTPSGPPPEAAPRRDTAMASSSPPSKSKKKKGAAASSSQVLEGTFAEMQPTVSAVPEFPRQLFEMMDSHLAVGEEKLPEHIRKFLQCALYDRPQEKRSRLSRSVSPSYMTMRTRQVIAELMADEANALLPEPPTLNSTEMPSNTRIRELTLASAHLYEITTRVADASVHTFARIQDEMSELVARNKNYMDFRKTITALMDYCLENNLANAANQMQHLELLKVQPHARWERDELNRALYEKNAANLMVDHMMAQIRQATHPFMVSPLNFYTFAKEVTNHARKQITKLAQEHKDVETLRAEKKALVKEKTQLQKSEKALNDRVEAMKTELNQAKNQVKNLEKRFASLQFEQNEEIARLRSALDTARNEIHEKEGQHSRDVQALNEAKRNHNKEMSERQQVAQRLKTQLEEKNAALRKAEQEKNSKNEILQKTAERAKTAELAIIDLKMENAIQQLERFASDCTANSRICEERLNAGGMTSDEIAAIRSSIQGYHSLKEEMGKLVEEARREHDKYCEHIKEGKMISQLGRIQFPKPPAVPQLPALPPYRKPEVVQPPPAVSTSNMAPKFISAQQMQGPPPSMQMSQQQQQSAFRSMNNQMIGQHNPQNYGHPSQFLQNMPAGSVQHQHMAPYLSSAQQSRPNIPLFGGNTGMGGPPQQQQQSVLNRNYPQQMPNVPTNSNSSIMDQLKMDPIDHALGGFGNETSTYNRSCTPAEMEQLERMRNVRSLWEKDAFSSNTTEMGNSAAGPSQARSKYFNNGAPAFGSEYQHKPNNPSTAPGPSAAPASNDVSEILRNNTWGSIWSFNST